MAHNKLEYQTLRNELDSILLALQQDDIDVDAAMQQYERGLELVALLETYLKDAENKVTKLKAQFTDKAD